MHISAFRVSFWAESWDLLFYWTESWNLLFDISFQVLVWAESRMAGWFTHHVASIYACSVEPRAVNWISGIELYAHDCYNRSMHGIRLRWWSRTSIAVRQVCIQFFFIIANPLGQEAYIHVPHEKKKKNIWKRSWTAGFELSSCIKCVLHTRRAAGKYTCMSTYVKTSRKPVTARCDPCFALRRSEIFGTRWRWCKPACST